MIFTSEPFPYGAAGTNRVLSHCYGLKKNGVDVVLVSTSPTSGNKGELLSVWPWMSNMEYFALPHIKQINSRISKVIHRNIAKLYFPIMLFFKFFKRDFEAVLVYGRNAYFENLLKKLCKKHNTLFLCEISEHPYAIISTKKKKRTSIEDVNECARHRYGLYDCLLVMTNPLLDYLNEIKLNNVKMLLTPQTVIWERFENIPRFKSLKFSDYIAFAGHLSNEKDGVLYLLEAYALIKVKYPFIKLVIAGYGPSDDLKLVKLFIDKHGLNDSVQLIVDMANNEIPSLISNAKLLVSSRPYGIQSEYGFPTKVAEYLATGKPVATTAYGDLKSYLINKENAFILESVDVEHIADTIISVFNDYERAKQVGENGKRLAMRKFDPQKNIISAIDYIEGISGSQNIPNEIRHTT